MTIRFIVFREFSRSPCLFCRRGRHNIARVRLGTDMRSGVAWLCVVLVALICRASVHAQDKVAEGEYQMRWSENGNSQTKTLARWTLTSASAGGYLLRSEILARSDDAR